MKANEHNSEIKRLMMDIEFVEIVRNPQKHGELILVQKLKEGARFIDSKGLSVV